MNITATKGTRNQELATATCDVCGAHDSVPASHRATRAFHRGGAPILHLQNVEQAAQKLRRKGWALVKNKLHCPECEAKRKSTEEPEMGEITMKATSIITPLRQPTIEQRRQIVEMLVIAYDGAAQRYKGRDTDKTVAEALGGGIMPGWVAEIREQNFGPAGGNEEMEAIRAEMASIKKDTDERLAALGKRFDAMCAAIGPRARR